MKGATVNTEQKRLGGMEVYLSVEQWPWRNNGMVYAGFQQPF